MRAPLAALALVTLLAWGKPAAAQDPTPPGPAAPTNRERVLDVARQIIHGARFCTLATIGEEGQPQARVVDPLEPDAGFVVFVATNPRSRKVAEIRKDPRVTLLYFDSARSAYVTLIGRAAQEPDALKRAHRKKEWDAFFPAEKPEAYTLYRIVPTRLEVVSARDGLNGDPSTWRPEIVEFKQP